MLTTSLPYESLSMTEVMAWYSLFTHGGQDKMAAIFQTTFSNGFSWMKMYWFWFKFHWNLFQRVKLTIFQHWFRKWLGTDQATSHYLNQWWSSLLTELLDASICSTRPQWVTNISVKSVSFDLGHSISCTPVIFCTNFSLKSISFYLSVSFSIMYSCNIS